MKWYHSMQLALLAIILANVTSYNVFAVVYHITGLIYIVWAVMLVCKESK